MPRNEFLNEMPPDWSDLYRYVNAPSWTVAVALRPLPIKYFSKIKLIFDNITFCKWHFEKTKMKKNMLNGPLKPSDSILQSISNSRTGKERELLKKIYFCLKLNCFVFKWTILGLSFHLSWFISNKQYKFYNKLMWKDVHPVSSTGIRTRFWPWDSSFNHSTRAASKLFSPSIFLSVPSKISKLQSLSDFCCRRFLDLHPLIHSLKHPNRPTTISDL